MTVIWLAVAPVFELSANGARRVADDDSYGYQYATNNYGYDDQYYDYYQGRSFQDGILSRVARALFNRYKSDVC